MELEHYNYTLPKEYIAQEPISKRSDSKLMVLCGSKIEHKSFQNIMDYLHKNDVLVVNESKVVPAKLVGKKSTGARVEVVLTKRIRGSYEAFITRRAKEGAVLHFPKKVSAKVIGKQGGFAQLKFSPQITKSVLEEIGQMPTPPYVRKPLLNQACYQTVFASKKGSIAAHTAGLHFTPHLLQGIKNKGVKIAKVCLHISYSTFFPIRGPIKRHKMHPELCSTDRRNADIINKRKGRLFAVGTTVVKTLESLSDENGMVLPHSTNSDLFIYPPHKFKVKMDALLTNFHLPKSTLLLLVCAYYGRERILKAYKEAIRRKYRFYSFGDAMLLLKTLT